MNINQEAVRGGLAMPWTNGPPTTVRPGAVRVLTGGGQLPFSAPLRQGVAQENTAAAGSAAHGVSVSATVSEFARILSVQLGMPAGALPGTPRGQPVGRTALPAREEPRVTRSPALALRG